MTATLTPTDQVQPPAPPPDAAPRSRRERVALGVLLLGTAALYLVNLSANGFANDFYAAAVQSMTKNWEAFFFGSFDAGNIVTVDKPPAALWVMALSGRVFGFSSLSMLVPQALMAVGTVALLYAAVRRVSGPGAALLAGTAMALTPVATLMFRFNNPDALLVLLMVAAAYAVVRAIEHASTRWLLLAGALMGLAFLTKTAQALLVLPALTLAYAWAAPTGLWRRIRQLIGAGVAMVVVCGWWFVAVALWPAATRPYIGGSTDNSAIQLALGYNGLGRIFGQNRGGGAGFAGAAGGAAPAGFAGGPGGAPGGSPFGGGAGLGRLFATDVGGQIAWLLPAALVLLVIGLVLTARFARTDRLRASLLLWGGWTVVSALVFSLMKGTFHQYYTVALAPGIAALIGIGGAQLWQLRDRFAARVGMAALVLLTAGWAWVLLARTPEFAPWVRWAVVALGVVGAALLLVPRRTGLIAAVALTATLVSGLLGPAAYAVQTVATTKSGGIVLAGPSTGGRGGFGDGRGARDRGAAGAGRNQRNGAATPGAPAAPGGAATADPGANGPGAGGVGGSGAGGSSAGGFGGGPGVSQPTEAALVSLLQSAGTKWSAATVASLAAAPLALDSGTDVMAIGGFTGSDPAPTLAQFQSYVSAGQVHYFISGGGGFGGGSSISTWVQQHFTATTVGGHTVYDLTKPINGG
ncbi:MAG TPA: glycosyltransferase family 39 protein [Pseudonocardia sp.]